MTINRIEALTFGVLDLDSCIRFFTDVGLEKVDAGKTGATLRTPENQFVNLRMADDPSLPPPLEQGATLREMVWGVDAQDGVTAIGAELEKDRTVTRSSDGVLHSKDFHGFGIAFTVSSPAKAETGPVRRYNVLRNIERLNEPLTAYEQPRPMRMLHVTLDIPKQGRQDAIDFYIKRLRFKPIDAVMDTGTFMQCEGDIEHHNFFLCFRPDKWSFNHVALEARNFDEVMESGNHMITRGWKESRVTGRHTLGSNVYRFFHCPAGGRVEFAADMDRMDKSYETRVWEKNPGHHIWSLKS